MAHAELWHIAEAIVDGLAVREGAFFLQVPYPQRLVSACGDQPALLRKVQRSDGVLVALLYTVFGGEGILVGAVGVPQANGAVRAAAGEILAVGAERQAGDRGILAMGVFGGNNLERFILF